MTSYGLDNWQVILSNVRTDSWLDLIWSIFNVNRGKRLENSDMFQYDFRYTSDSEQYLNGVQLYLITFDQLYVNWGQ